MDAIKMLDVLISEEVQAHFNPIVNGFFNVVTRCGDWYSISLLFICLAFYLKKHGNLKKILYPVISVCGFWVVFFIIKNIVQRPRPAGIHLVDAAGYSFPSMHAGISLIFYGWLCYTLFEAEIIKKKTAVIISGITAFLIGISRIMMNVHYLSDILVGWILGGCFLFLLIRFSDGYQCRRGRL